MKIPPDRGHAICECQEDEDYVYWHNQKTDDSVKIIYKHWKGGHRSRLPICKAEFIKLCKMHPRAKELCDWFKVDHDTLVLWANKTFPEYDFKTISDLICQLGGKFTFGLRKFLWDHAEKSPQACIFLAKNYLGMRDQLPEDVQDIAVETINYHIQEGKGIGLWNEAKKIRKRAEKGEILDT